MGGNKAKYTLLIPQGDGGRAAAAAHEALAKGARDARIDHSFIEPNKLAHNPGESPSPHDFVVAYADDLPEHDSHVKQLAASICRSAGHPVIHVLKEGKDGIVQWVVDHPEAHNAPGLDNGASDGPTGIKGESAPGLAVTHAPMGKGASYGLSRRSNSTHEAITFGRPNAFDGVEHGFNGNPVDKKVMNKDGMWQFNVGNQRPEVVRHWLKKHGLGADVHTGVGQWGSKPEPTTRVTFYSMQAMDALAIFKKLCHDFPQEHSFGCIPPGAQDAVPLRNIFKGPGTEAPEGWEDKPELIEAPQWYKPNSFPPPGVAQ